jgi:SAM-dependent methyltransferase
MEDRNVKTENSMLGFEVAIETLGEKARFPSKLDMSNLNLDVGCGSKPTGDVNVDFCVRGWNIQEGDQKRGEFLNPKVIPNFVVADAEHLPFKDNIFNVVFSSHVIEHVHNPFLMLKEMCRVSKRKVVVRCPHRKGSGAKRPFHLHYLDEEWFEDAASKLGLNVKSFVRCFDSLVTERVKLLCPVTLLDAVQSSMPFRAMRHLERSLQRRGYIKTPFELEIQLKKRLQPSNDANLVFIVVYDNPAIFQKCFGSSPFVQNGDAIAVYNSRNDSLPYIFNLIIEQFLDKNAWLVFCHQDFILQEPLQPLLKGKDSLAVYGVIGCRVGYNKLFGQILQTDGSLTGFKLAEDAPVETLDEMCLIVHSSAFRQGLMFDERFGFHFYGADLCMQAHNLGFEVLATQVMCQHKSRTLKGDVESMEYIRGLELFREKWRKALPVKTTTRIVEA